MKKSKVKTKKRMKKKNHRMYIISNISYDASHVESMAKNLVIGDVLENEKKAKYKKRMFESCYSSEILIIKF